MSNKTELGEMGEILWLHQAPDGRWAWTMPGVEPDWPTWVGARFPTYASHDEAEAAGRAAVAAAQVEAQ